MTDELTPDWLWCFLLERGIGDLSEPERQRLIDWAAALPSAAQAELLAMDGAAAGLEALALACNHSGQYDAMGNIARLGIAAHEHRQQPDPAGEVVCHAALCLSLCMQKRWDEAEPAIARYRARIAPHEPEGGAWTAAALLRQSDLAEARGRIAESLALDREALTMAERSSGLTGKWTNALRREALMRLERLGRQGEIEALCRDLLARIVSDDEDADPLVREALHDLIVPLPSWEDQPHIEAAIRRCVMIAEGAFGTASDETLDDLIALGKFLLDAGRAIEAEPVFRRAIDLASDPPTRAHTRATLAFWLAASVNMGRGDLAEAEALFRTAIEDCTRHHSPLADITLYSRKGLGNVLEGQGRWKESDAELAALAADAEAERGLDDSVAAEMGAAFTRFRRRWLAHREQGRLFGWARRELKELEPDPAALAIAMLYAVAQQIDSQGDHDRLSAEAAALRTHHGTAADGPPASRGRIAEECVDDVRAGRWAEALAALNDDGDRARRVLGAIGIAHAAAEDDDHMAAEALRVAFQALLGGGAEPPGLDAGRRLGEAARRLLADDARAAFIEAALTEAAKMTDVMAAAPLVVAAGHAAHSPRRLLH